jgi:hypothetical protein
MNDHATKLLSALRADDAEQVDEVFPLEFRQDLLETIALNVPIAPAKPVTSLAPRQRRRRPRALGALGALGATAAVAVTVMVLATDSAVGPAPAEAVSFHTASSGDIVATVTDPFATRARLNAAFAKQGLHIRISLIPVSPSAVGKVVYLTVSSSRGPQIGPLREGHCVSAGADCLIGLRIPRDFTATATIGLGRPAKSGEKYESQASAFAPGEPLHCSGLLGATVAHALPVLERDKLTVVRWDEDVEVASGSSGASSRSRSVARPPINDHIWSAVPVAAGRLMVQVESTPWPGTPGTGSFLNNGC